MEIKKVSGGISCTYVISKGLLASEFGPNEILYMMDEGELDQDWIDGLKLEGICLADGSLTDTGKRVAVFLKENLVVVDGHIYDRKALSPLPLTDK